MALISNLVARLSMDSKPFEAGLARSHASMRGMTAGMYSMQSAAIKLGAAYFAAKGIIRGLQAFTQAAAENERAERSLATAMQIRGRYSEQTFHGLVRFADEMQRLTRHNNEQIKDQMAYALALGAGTDELERMTRAAIGLSAAYGKDLHESMRIIGLAREGETTQLRRMGIVLDQTKGRHERYLQLLNRGESNFSRATEDAKTLTGSIEQLRNEWSNTKEELTKPFVPALTRALQAIRAELANNPTAISPYYTIKTLPQSHQDAIWRTYRQRLQEQAQARMPSYKTATRNDWVQEPEYLKRLTAAYARSGEIQDKIKAGLPGTDGAKALPESIFKLNRALREQIEIERLSAAGHEHAAEIVRYRTAVEEEFGKGTRDSIANITKYESALRTLAEAQKTRTIEDYIEALRDEGDELSLLRGGYDDQARLLQVVNDFKRQNIILTDDQTAAIRRQIEANERLRRGYGDDVAGGVRAGIKQIKEELGGLGDLSFDLTIEGINGISSSLTDAVFEARNLGDALEEVARSMAKMAFQWGMQQIVTGGLGMVFGGVAHGGGEIGRSAFPTRRVSAAAFAGAPRLHEGLGSDEFPAVLQRGEQVTSRQGVASENRMMGRMVTLLERIADKEMTAKVAVVRDRGEILNALRTRDGRRAIAEVVQETQQ